MMEQWLCWEGKIEQRDATVVLKKNYVEKVTESISFVNIRGYGGRLVGQESR